MNAQACFCTILLICLKSSLVFAGEFCYFHGQVVNYCPTGKHCCSRLRDQCCRDQVSGFSVWAIVFISIFAVALLVASVYMLYRRLRSRRRQVGTGVATSDVPAVPAINVQTATLYPQGQQRIAMVVASYPRQDTRVNDGNLPPPYPTDDHPPAYPGYTTA